MDAEQRAEKRDIKPVVKTLNRVPRACNACRKQKMRCEGAENPPCKRCRNTNLECLFEKPSREATLTGEAGLERIRSLEAHVAEIRNTQAVISNTLSELVSHLRAGSLNTRSPSTYSQPFHRQSPNLNSPSMSTPTAAHQHISEAHPSSPGDSGVFHQITSPARQPQGSVPNTLYQAPSSIPPPNKSAGDFTSKPPVQPFINNQAPQGYHIAPNHVLPPFSSLSTMGPPSQSNVSSVRYQAPENANPRSSQLSNSKSLASSNAVSTGSSDLEDDENGELPASGLLAPWEVLRGLADVAIKRAAQENGDGSGVQSRDCTPSPDRKGRPSKRRRISHKLNHYSTSPDVVSKKIISKAEARELFDVFYRGCSTFLPVFDCNSDTFDSLHERFPFAVDCICMVGARTRDNGGGTSETYLRILEEVQAISCATLFAPVIRNEAVRAMILVAGWSDNGWLSGGHAVRMALELSMHTAWPKLLQRMNQQRAGPEEDKSLVVAVRTWFCLYLFEHQLSYGSGRPAILRDDDSLQDCRLFLQHPLSIDDDMRLISTVELMKIRERINNALSPIDGPVKEEHFTRLREADIEFDAWYKFWDHVFSQKYEDAAFYRQSLQIQQLHAQLFHMATALRGINGPEDVQNMPHSQRQLSFRSIQVARKGLDITVNSPAYREGMKYAVHYTHAAATFAASFLLRLARLFPNECSVLDIWDLVERLVNLMSEIPGKRYALTLQLMLKRSKSRIPGSSSHSPESSSYHMMTTVADHSASISPSVVPDSQRMQEFPYETSFSGANIIHGTHANAGTFTQHQPLHLTQPQQREQYPSYMPDAEQIWRGFEMTSNEQLPVWMSDQSLGGNSFTQHGMDAFLLPTDYMPSSQIW